MIRIYDRAGLTALFATVRYTSLQWTSRFYDIGTVEVHFPRGSEAEPYLEIGNYITHGSKCGVILNVTYTSTDVQVVGRDTKVFLKWRVVIPPGYYDPVDTEAETQILHAYDRIKGTGETVMKHYVTNHITDPLDREERQMANTFVAADQQRGKDMAWQSRFGSLAEEIKKIALYNDLGYGFVFDPAEKKFTFDVYEGTNRIVNQSERPPCIFIRERKTLTDTEYSLDYLSAVSCVYVGDSKEDEEQYVQKMKQGETWSIYTEAYMDGGVDFSSSEDAPEELQDKGIAYLAENRPAENLTGTATSRLVYGVDWFLGDYVTVQERIGSEIYQVDLQITEVTETEERGNVSIQPVFGEPKKDIIKILKG